MDNQNPFDCPLGSQHQVEINETKERVLKIEIGQARLFEKLDSLVEVMKNREDQTDKFLQIYSEQYKTLEDKFDRHEKDQIKNESKFDVKYWVLIALLLALIVLITHQLFPALITFAVLQKIAEAIAKYFTG